MASNAAAGVGTSFRRWDGSNFVAIAEINSITGPGMTRDTIDVTSLDSTGGYREFITGFRNPGTVTLAMNFTITSYDLMHDDFEDPNAQNYEILLPTEAGDYSFEFEGYVTELPLTIPPDDKITADVTIQISGAVVVNTGAASSAI